MTSTATAAVAALEGRRPQRGNRGWVLPGISAVLAVVLWEVFAQLGVIPIEMSSPSAVLPWIWSEVQDGGFWLSLGVTLYQWLIGLMLAVVAGVVIGLGLGTNRVIAKLFLVPVEFLRPIPAILLLPLVLLIFGATDAVGSGLTAFSAMWIIMFQTINGVQSIDRLAVDTARMFGLTRLQRVRYVLIPGMAPSIATGIRLAAAVSLVVVITVELVGGVPGLGADLRRSQVNNIYPAVYGLVFILGVLGLALNVGLEYVERKVLKWHEPHRPRS